MKMTRMSVGWRLEQGMLHKGLVRGCTCEKTMALAEGSRCSMSASSSRRASILVLLWKLASCMRFRMQLFRAPTTRAGACTISSYMRVRGGLGIPAPVISS